MIEKNLLVGISGSIAVMGIVEYLSGLQEIFKHIRIIMTYSANRFIPASSLAMFAEEIYVDEFSEKTRGMNHVELARWADLFLVLPATAHLLAQVAHGFAGNLLSATLMAYEKSAIFFPNMNRVMWDKPAVQRNVIQLEKDGHRMISPIEKIAFEYASKQRVPCLVMPSVESVISISQLAIEVGV